MAAADTKTLQVGLDQLAELIGRVTSSNSGDSTPCSEWTVADLVDHIVSGTGKFAQMLRGEKIDWTAPTPHLEGGRDEVYRSAADALLRAWSDAPDDGAESPTDWQCAEIAVHTWDLATALGAGTVDLDPSVAERGYAFMRANLTDEARGSAFAPATSAPEGIDAYTRIAAFAGRAM